MSLSKEEQSKLYSEINQLLNQRFLVTTTGITVFGAFAAFLIPKSDLAIGEAPVRLLYVGTAFIYVFLALLVYWAGTLQNAVRMISQYLIKRGVSEWEVDVEALFNSSIPHGSSYTWNVFGALGIASCLWPFAVEMTTTAQLIDQIAMRHLVVLVSAVAYFSFLCYTAVIHTNLRKKQLIVGWDVILKDREPTSTRATDA